MYTTRKGYALQSVVAAAVTRFELHVCLFAMIKNKYYSLIPVRIDGLCYSGKCLSPLLMIP
jgi:hypothetical protein